MTLPTAKTDLPFVTTDQMREVDRIMIEDLGITLLQMMENAGRGLARFAATKVQGPSRIAVLAGSGGNGGGALVAGRRLAGWGHQVDAFVTGPAASAGPAAQHQRAILEAMGVRVTEGRPQERYDLVLDGVIGYSLLGAPRGAAADLIRWANDQDAPVVSLDVPSGLDATTGEAPGPVVRAVATCTLALPKTGLRAPEAAGAVGEVILMDIAVPSSAYAAPSLGLSVESPFEASDLVRIVIAVPGR
ncbi:MAG: NAD(P)H-hydrate epimerase [Myxococcota bacterium]